MKLFFKKKMEKFWSIEKMAYLCTRKTETNRLLLEILNRNLRK